MESIIDFKELYQLLACVSACHWLELTTDGVFPLNFLFFGNVAHPLHPVTHFIHLSFLILGRSRRQLLKLDPPSISILCDKG